MTEAFPPFKWVVILYNLALFALLAAMVWRVWMWRGSHPVAVRILTSGGLLLCLAGLAGALVSPVEHGFGRIQLVAWMAFLHYPAYLASTAPAFWPKRPRVFAGCLAAAALIVVVSIDAFWIEPHNLDVTCLRVVTPKVDSPLRIALLADIQADAPGAYERKVLQRVRDERCDLVLLAGDTIQTQTQAQLSPAVHAMMAVFSEADLNPRLGIFAVRGNIDGQDWPLVFDRLPVTCIETRREFDLGPAILTGLSVGESFDPACQVPARDKFHIVLGHCPNFSLGRVEADLLLAGHTHGGQVRLPLVGPLFTFSLIPRSWASGVTHLKPEGPVKDRTLVVSRGIGMERKKAPRLRFLCRPELVIIDVVPAAGGEKLRG
jgi:uncharacterized protein